MMIRTANNLLPRAWSPVLPLAACLALVTSCNSPGSQSGGDSGSDTQSGDSTESVQPALTQVWKTDSTFTGSESTLYDPETDLIYVSCGNTDGAAKDGDGFIALLNPDGSVNEMNWVDGLDAPKGMALLGGKLYVTDIDEVKIIDVAGATVEKTVPVEGAVFLNDVATDGTSIYFSDSRAGIIHSMDQEGAVTTLVENVENINGLECHNGNLYTLDKEGLKVYDPAAEQPVAELINSTVTGGDGLVILNDSTFVASRWAGQIYFVKGGEATLLIDTEPEKSNTADIGYIPDQQLVLVPTFLKNEVAAYKLEK